MKTVLDQKILLIGQSGFLGSELIRNFKTLNLPVDSLAREFFDFETLNFDVFQKLMSRNKYQYVLICAAIADVEKCFLDQKLSRQVNVTGTIELLKQIQKNQATPIFFSTDYVFSDGKEPYIEEQKQNPKTIYGKQKVEIEKFIESHFQQYLILRTSKLMSKTPHPRSILTPILQNLKTEQVGKYFTDQLMSPVFVEDIALVIQALIRKKASGIFHLGTRKIYSKYELARFLAAQLGYPLELASPIQMKDIPFSEPRPTYNVLNCEKVEKALSFHFCEIEEAIPDLKKLLLENNLGEKC